MRKVIMSSQKGGTGKTTTAVNLAAVYGRSGHRVLLVDLDTQGNTTTSYDAEEHEDALYELCVKEKPLEEVVYKTAFEGVDLIASGAATDHIEADVPRKDSKIHVLRAHLDELTGYDFVLLDAPTGAGFMTKAGMVSARELLITFDGSLWAMTGTAQTFELMKMIRNDRFLNPDLVLLGVLITNRDMRLKNQAEYIAEGRSAWGDDVFMSTVIRTDATLGRAQSTGPIVYTNPSSKGAADYQELAEEILKRDLVQSYD